jgi:O-antigen/teichoic acid export membrane protein
MPYVFGRVLSSALTAGNQQRFDLVAAICATTVNLTLNALLIPHFGSTGSAIAFCSSLTVGCGLIAGFTTRVMGKAFLSTALKWGVGVVTGVACLCWLAMSHELVAVSAFLVVFSTAAGIYLIQNSRWRQILAGSVSVYRDLVSP